MRVDSIKGVDNLQVSYFVGDLSYGQYFSTVAIVGMCSYMVCSQ